jgi:glycine/D-amino acid oxidase-like deaminating enzyme
VGHGLAGACLALQLRERNAEVLIFDTPSANYSSRLAAGLYNPVTGRKMTKTWLADRLFPYLVDFYQHAEQLLDEPFLHHQPIYRPFFSIEEQNEWMAKEGDTAYQDFLEQVIPKSLNKPGIKDPYGGIMLKGGGYLDIPAFLEASKNYWSKAQGYVEETFDESQLTLFEDHVSYKDWKAKKIIFANGLSAAQSQFWSFLPFHALKGEILDVEGEGLSTLNDFILNRGVFIFQNASSTFRCGSTYNWRSPDLQATKEAEEEILGKLHQIFSAPVEVKDHKVGIRPSTMDRRPFVGIHPSAKQVAILNGLGTKGVSLAPYFSAQLADLLINGKSVDPKVDIARYLS